MRSTRRTWLVGLGAVPIALVGKGKKRHRRMAAGGGSFHLVGADVKYKLDFNTQAVAGFFASMTGSPTGAGTFADPWDLLTATRGGPGYTFVNDLVTPGTAVQPGDTVWIRGGTYTNPYQPGGGGGRLGNFAPQLTGTAANPITFRGYPGERAIIDGNYDPADTGYSGCIFGLKDYFGARGYMILRDVEITNSRAGRLCTVELLEDRNDGFSLTAPHSKVINCIIHDTGQGGFPSSGGAGWEVYGNLIYYNGVWDPVAEPESVVSIDLISAGGTAVALSGSAEAPTGTSPQTVSHNNTGDYTVVCASANDAPYTDLSVTYDGVAMTRLNYLQGPIGSIAMFGLAGHSGTHNVVVTDSGGGYVSCTAQSFVNVHQTTQPTALGTWFNNSLNSNQSGATVGTVTDLDDFDIGAAWSSAANNLVVDGIRIQNTYGTTYAPSGNNVGNIIGGAAPGGNPSGNPITRMSWASGAASVSMRWGWVMSLAGHGHGLYVQAGGSDTVVTVNGDTTVNWNGTPAVNGPFRSYIAGAAIRIIGAGSAGADLVTTITTYVNNGQIVVQDAPSAGVTDEATWGHPCVLKDNIVLDEVVESMQVYGSSGAAAINITLSGNFHFNNRVTLGGLSGFRVTDSEYDGNYTWSGTASVGYQMTHLRNFVFSNNYLNDSTTIATAPSTWEDLSLTGNTFIGAIAGFTSGDFPTNDYSFVGTNPTTNVIVVRPNDYEANRANIYVYNWENLTSVNVDISSAVAVGTPIYVMNAQNYYATPVYSGTYGGGTINLPTTAAALPAAAAIGGTGGDAGATFTPVGTMAPGCAVFIVRAQSEETWR